MHEPARNYTRILVPVDFSPASAASLVYALSLGSAAGGVVDALHVWRTNTETPIHVARERVKDSLRDFLATVAIPAGSELRRRTEYGDPYLTILQIAQLSGYDLLVCVAPRPGRDGPNHVGASLLRSTRLPVLLVPRPWAEARRQPDLHRHLRRVLVPAAFGGRCLAAVDRVLEIARTFDAQVEVLFVDDPAAAGDQARLSAHLEARTDVAKLVERSDKPGPLAAVLGERAEAGGYDLFLAVERSSGLQGNTGDPLTNSLLPLQRCPVLCEREKPV